MINIDTYTIGLKEAIETRSYPVIIKNDCIQSKNSNDIISYNDIIDIKFKDTYIIIHDLDNNIVRIDEKGVTIFTKQWVREQALSLGNLMKEAGIDILEAIEKIGYEEFYKSTVKAFKCAGVL